MNTKLNPAEPLWPQILRYAISIVGTYLAARGVASEADMEVIAGAAVAAAPVVYRVAATLAARWRTK